MAILTPKVLISDLLREKLTDPRDRTVLKTETFGDGEDEYELSPDEEVQSITSVTVGETTLKKWVDYFWDYQNNKIKLKETASDDVVVIYKDGPGWIFPEKPAKKLTDTDFPRINIQQIAGTSTRFGQSNAPMEDTYALQIDIWVKDDFIYNDGTNKHEGNALAELIGINTKNTISRNVESLYPYAYSIAIPTGLRDLPYDEEFQSHHKILILEINSLNENEVNL